MSRDRVRAINQRWLASMGLDDETIALRDGLLARVETMRRKYGARPPWWRPFKRRMWIRWMTGVEERAIEAMKLELQGLGLKQRKGPTMSTLDIDFTTWSDGSLLSLVDELRKQIAAETNDDVRTMRGYRLDEALAEVRRRNEARARTIAEAKLS